MTTISHPDLVAALKKPGADILASSTPKKVDAWHMASCIPGEAGELCDAIQNNDRENVVEELGDLEFYIDGLARPLGFDLTPLLTDVEFSRNLHGSLPGAAGDVFDVVKKWVIYNKDLDIAEFGVACLALLKAMAAIRIRFGITREQTIEHNIAKLSKRYASLSYNDQAARDRADKVDAAPRANAA